MLLFRNSSTRSRWQCKLSARAKTQCQISEDAPRRIFSGDNSVHAWIFEKKKKKRIDVLTIEWKICGALGLAEDEQKARVYAHKVDLAPLNMHIGLGPPIVIPHRRCQALLTRQFCHGNAPTLYFNARKEIIRVNMGKRGRSARQEACAIDEEFSE